MTDEITEKLARTLSDAFGHADGDLGAAEMLMESLAAQGLAVVEVPQEPDVKGTPLRQVLTAEESEFTPPKTKAMIKAAQQPQDKPKLAPVLPWGDERR